MHLTGNPATTYINASWIQFAGTRQNFIAAQAPLPCSLENWWLLVGEAGVRLVVSLTGLEEGGKKKSDQYWPDGEMGASLELGDGTIVETLSQTSYQAKPCHSNKTPEYFTIYRALNWVGL